MDFLEITTWNPYHPASWNTLESPKVETTGKALSEKNLKSAMISKQTTQFFVKKLKHHLQSSQNHYSFLPCGVGGAIMLARDDVFWGAELRTPESSKITRSFYVFFAFLVWPFFRFQLRSPWSLVLQPTTPQAPGRRVAWLVVFRRLALRRLPLGWFQCLWMAPVPRSMEGAGGCWVAGVHGVGVGVGWWWVWEGWSYNFLEAFSEKFFFQSFWSRNCWFENFGKDML